MFEFANKPINQQQWGTILDALENKVKELRFTDGKKWKQVSLKDPQVRFYNDVVQEFRAFNEVWRRYISHADTGAFYDRDEAMGILKHVRTFMQKLSVRISETAQTLEFWESE